MANETILRNGLISKGASEVEATLGVRGLQMLNSSNAVQYTFPTADSTGNSGYALTTNGAGTLSFTAPADLSSFLENITAESIHDLNDVESATGIVTGDVLQWSGSIWEHVAATSIGTTTLEGLTDTTSDVSTNAVSGDFLKWNGTDWDHHTLGTGDITSAMVTQHEGDIEITVSQVTDFDPSDYVTTTTANSTYVLQTSVGAANGVASLDASGLVPSTQLPSYVDDVIEFDQPLATPGSPVTGDLPTGETASTGKIYVDTATNDVYRWSGSAFVNITDFAAPDHNISTHGDVNISSIGADEVLQWSGSEWQNQTLDELGMSIGNMSDVDITSTAPTEGQVLAWNNTDSEFQPINVSSLSTSDSVGSLTDTTISGTPADNELLAYDTATSEWINQTAAEAGLAIASHTHTHDDITDFDAESATIADTQIAAADIQDLNNVTNITAGFLQSNGTNATFVTIDSTDVSDFETAVDTIIGGTNLSELNSGSITDLDEVSTVGTDGQVLVSDGTNLIATSVGLYERFEENTIAGDGAKNILTIAMVGGRMASLVDYVIYDAGVGMRTGTVRVATDGSSVEVTDISTNQIGSDSTEPTWDSVISGGNILVRLSNADGYTAKGAFLNLIV